MVVNGGEDEMKELKTVQTKGKLNVVFAIDEKGVGGAHHEYAILHARDDEEVTANITEFTFQKGARKDPDSTSGVLDQDLLEIVKDRMTGFQEGKFASEYNAKALYHINKALESLNQRVEDRISRNVFGTYKK